MKWFFFRCDLCEETFEKWSVYRKHKAKIHRKDYKCEICFKEFKTKNNIRTHLATHDQERDVFRCHYPMCKRWYVFEKNLKMHISDYHELGRFSCPVEGCNARFKSRTSKGRHIKKNHTEKDVVMPKVSHPRPCGLCYYIPPLV